MLKEKIAYYIYSLFILFLNAKLHWKQYDAPNKNFNAKIFLVIYRKDEKALQPLSTHH